VRHYQSTNRANVIPAPVSIVDRETFCLMDLSRVAYVISICEYESGAKWYYDRTSAENG
jgi:hypothetical protein